MKTQTFFPYLLILPFFILFIIFFISPLLVSMVTSLHDIAGNFIGLHNYSRLITDNLFWNSISNILFLAFLGVIIIVVVSVGLAMLLDSDVVKFKKILTTAIFLPYAIPSATASLLWSFIYNPKLGPYTMLFNSIGVQPNFFSQALVGYAIVNILTWEYAGYNTVLLLASLTTISPDIYDAAAIDGARGFKVAFWIKIPMIRNTIFMIMILSFIGWFQLFTEPFFVNVAAHLPLNYTPNMYIFNTAFSGRFDVPYSTSMALVFAIILFGASYMMFVRTTMAQLRKRRR